MERWVTVVAPESELEEVLMDESVQLVVLIGVEALAPVEVQ